jgi:hypothetical protein
MPTAMAIEDQLKYLHDIIVGCQLDDDERETLVADLLVRCDQLLGTPAELAARRSIVRPVVDAELGALFRKYIRPTSVIIQMRADWEPLTVEVAGGQPVYVGGISSLNISREIHLVSLGPGDRIILRDVDLAIYNTALMFVPCQVGYMSRLHPLICSFRPFDRPSIPPTTNLILWGETEEEARLRG